MLYYLNNGSLIYQKELSVKAPTLKKYTVQFYNQGFVLTPKSLFRIFLSNEMDIGRAEVKQFTLQVMLQTL